jgi:hypothetical protein
MRRTLAAAIGTLSVAALISGAGLVAASAAPAASGTEHFQAVSTATSSRTSVIFTGAFTAGGVASVGRTTGTFTVPGGTFKIRHSRGTGKQTFNPRTCLLTVSRHGTYTLGHGTGKYAGISGHGTYQLHILAVARKAHGKCSQSLPPAAFQQIINASGPVSLP